MALKVMVDSLDEVSEGQRDLYEVHEGKYRLKLEGLEDTGALKRAKDHEKEARKAAEAEVERLREEVSVIRNEMDASKDADAKKKGDIEALDKSWGSKLAKREQELQSQIDSLNGCLRSTLIDREAVRLASELAVEGSADLLMPHIKSRLGVEEKDGQFVTVVNDSEGKPSALTLDELKAEFSSNKAFAPVLAGSKASGGSADSGGDGGASKSGSDKAGRIAAAQKAGDLTGFIQENIQA